MSWEERRFTVNGVDIAAQWWQRGQGGTPVLALHGWLDNAASFAELAPLLGEREMLAMDLPGHGLSSHRQPPGSYNIWDDLLDILGTADAVRWECFDLVGHSRGALIAVLLAAAMPERVRRLALLDAVWPMPVRAADAPAQLRRYVLEQRQVLAKPKAVPRYETMEQAVEARRRATGLDAAAAEHIVRRGVQPHPAGGFCWRTDPRLLLSSAFKLTQEHNRAFLSAVRAPVLALLARHGFGGYPGVVDALAGFAGVETLSFDAPHHLHMGQTAAPVGAALRAFLER